MERRAEEFDKLRARMETDLEEAGEVRRKYESALSAAREEVEVLKQTIETQVASHRLLLARYDAETEIQVRLQTAASGNREQV